MHGEVFFRDGRRVAQRESETITGDVGAGVEGEDLA